VLGLENMGNQGLFETSDEIQLHRIALKSLVILEGQAQISDEYLCGMKRPYSAPIIHGVIELNLHGNMQVGDVLIDCDVTSIFISPSLLRTLSLPHKQAFTSTQSLNGQVMMNSVESRMATLRVQYSQHLNPVDKLEDLVIQMKGRQLSGFSILNTLILLMNWTIQ